MRSASASFTRDSCHEYICASAFIAARLCIQPTQILKLHKAVGDPCNLTCLNGQYARVFACACVHMCVCKYMFVCLRARVLVCVCYGPDSRSCPLYKTVLREGLAGLGLAMNALLLVNPSGWLFTGPERLFHPALVAGNA